MNNRSGVVILVALGTAVILSVLGAAFFGTSFVNQHLTERKRSMALSLETAEAGLERVLFDLRRDFIGDPEGDASWTDGSINGYPIMPVSGGFTDFPYTGTDLNGGSYRVRLKSASGNGREIWVSSIGTVDAMPQALLVYARMKNYSMWSTAAFSGSGDNGPLMNGNAEIHGSVHILNTDAKEDSAMEMGGTAFISNTYNDSHGALSSRLDEMKRYLPLEDTLEAEVRVRRGRVVMDGNASVGLGSGESEYVEGTYVPDGFFSKNGSDACSQVFSKNGCRNQYDLNDKRLDDFPLLTPEYRAYFREGGDGVLEITEKPLRIGDHEFSFRQGSNRLEFKNGRLTVNGRVIVNGNLEITGRDAISYEGVASILVNGNVSVETDLYTRHSFPGDIIGIMASGSIELGVKRPHTDVMGLFYAQDTVSLGKQTTLAGTVAGNYFSLGAQVPAIFQVPSTVDHLPPKLIGSDPIWVMKVVSWRKDKVP